MSNTICGADCSICGYSKGCKGCTETGGRPFGGSCIAAEYIKTGGIEKYEEFKQELLNEINSLLKDLGIPEAEELWELPGWFVDLTYRLPNGKGTNFLDGSKVYLGAQIEAPGPERCWGVAADTDFILICSYGEGGSDPELVMYKKR